MLSFLLNYGRNMTKPISRRLHGLITDYPYVALVSTAPETIGFKDEQTATTLCRTLGGGILGSSLLTRAEWGAVPAISFKTHLVLDVVNGLFAASAPWVFGFSENRRARNFFLVAGAFGIAAGLLSQPEEMNKQEQLEKFGED